MNARQRRKFRRHIDRRYQKELVPLLIRLRFSEDQRAQSLIQFLARHKKEWVLGHSAAVRQASQMIDHLLIEGE